MWVGIKIGVPALAHDDGCTVIIVTHDPAVAEQADTVLQMKDGAWI